MVVWDLVLEYRPRVEGLFEGLGFHECTVWLELILEAPSPSRFIPKHTLLLSSNSHRPVTTRDHLHRWSSRFMLGDRIARVSDVQPRRSCSVCVVQPLISMKFVRTPSLREGFVSKYPVQLALQSACTWHWHWKCL